MVLPKEKEESLIDKKALSKYNLIWFDESVDNQSNKSVRPSIKPLFNKCIYCGNIDKFKKEVKSSKYPVVALSPGGMYESHVAEFAEEEANVSMIIIYCFKIQNHIEKLKRHVKIRGVVNNPTDLIRKIREGFMYFLRVETRFSDIGDEKTFYPLEAQQLILDTQGVNKVFHSTETNIFYPLYFGNYKPPESEWKGMIEKMKDTANLVKGTKKKSEREMEDFEERIVELEKDNSVKSIMEAYTGNGLYPTFNEQFRKGTKESLKAFNYYAFCLRGAMASLGEYVKKTSKAFRGLDLAPRFIKKWEEYKGEIVLLSAYTSTSKLLSIVDKTFSGNTLIEFTFLEDQKEFVDKLDVFAKVWNGFYYPVDIHRYSKYAGEEEILFPPFYPIRIDNVIHRKIPGVKREYIIQVTTPIFLNIGKWTSAIFEDRKGLIKELEEAHCEKILSLLSNGWIKQLDFSKKMLQDLKPNQRKKLITCISSATNLESLDLNQNFDLNPEEVALILKNNHCLKVFNLSICNFSAEKLRIIAEQGLVHNRGLKSLNLDYNKGANEGTRGLSNAIAQMENNCRLEVLSLDFNTIGADGAEALAISLSLNKSLIFLSLRANIIGIEGLLKIGEALEVNNTLESLHLGDNRLSDGEEELGIKAFCISLIKNTSLRLLNLSMNELSVDAGVHLADLLMNNKTLRTLKYGDNILSYGLDDLKDALIQNSTLKVLDLQKNDIKDEDGVIFGEILEKNCSILNFNLSNNEFKENTILAIGKSLKTNVTLISLNLSYNKYNLSQAGINEIHGALTLENCTLRTLNLGKCHLKDEDCVLVVEALSKNHSLKELLIFYNYIAELTIKALTQAIPSNNKLETLDISSSMIEDAVVEDIKSIIKDGKGLRKLIIEKNQFSQCIIEELIQFKQAYKGIEIYIKKIPKP